MVTIYVILLIFILLLLGAMILLRLRSKRHNLSNVGMNSQKSSIKSSELLANLPELSTRGQEAWNMLRKILLETDQGWEILVDWYEQHLAGTIDEDRLPLAIAAVREPLWKLNPKIANEELRRLLQEDTSLEPVPFQSINPIFGLAGGARLRVVGIGRS
jgi:hypothetical protein